MRALTPAALAFAVIAVASAVAQESPARAVDERLGRIFDANGFAAPRFGPARWRPDGISYAMVEPSATAGGGFDIARYDAATGTYKRHWGAYGKPPDDTQKFKYPVNVANPPQQYSTLHGLVGSKDGLIYVSDRRGNRIQVFRQNGEYLMERFVRPETGGSGSGFSLQFSRDPEQSLLYLIDGTNQRIDRLFDDRSRSGGS